MAGVSVVWLLCGCAPGRPPAPNTIPVVAAENFWGSLAGQLGGSRASVQSVVTDPNADPHEYESSIADARAFADAGLVILNGAGYDDWGQKLLDANPASGRRVVNVATLLGKRRGDNPHFWYSPAYVVSVADRITAEYKAIDAADAGYFDARRSALAVALQPYLDEVAAIRRQHSGMAVGSTENVFVYMADALGLDLTTPPAFMNAVAQGTDPPASSVALFQDQIGNRRIQVLVYNPQTINAVTANIKALAQSQHIPTVGASETISPPGLSFEEWQLQQLRALEAAL
ncbi:MAG TPA: zinc ABC transporter substrate-binding protein [Candidatus Dormibacteraeota bacterium]|nr:zinc ABC transporter substrate-binding protein [Candidatus Dormibacteraeota bacterium]